MGQRLECLECPYNVLKIGRVKREILYQLIFKILLYVYYRTGPCKKDNSRACLYC